LAAHESIHEYYLHQHRNIQYYLELCAMHPEEELVHELRLSIKKLRAFLKLAEQICLTDMAEHIHIKHRVRQLFKVSGQLRDIQVQIQILSSFQEKTGIDYLEFRNWLLKREVKRISRFSKNPKQVVPQAIAESTHQKIGKLLADSTDESILDGAMKVLVGLYSEAKSLSAGNLDDRNLHRIRTITKQMRYVLNIMHHSYPDFVFNEISVETLREIEVAAGHWHDNLVRIEMLEKFINKMKPVDDVEKFKYQKLFNECKAELDISFNMTSQMVRQALNQ